VNEPGFCWSIPGMNRQQLEHIIRAAAANADVEDIVVIGSQAILGKHPPQGFRFALSAASRWLTDGAL